ncbi:MAG: hypothetical protein ACI4R5_03250 [Acetatifactor sp.]
MIKIPVCFSCDNYIGVMEVGGKKEHCCKAFPEGIPNMQKQTRKNECAKEIGYVTRQQY